MLGELEKPLNDCCPLRYYSWSVDVGSNTDVVEECGTLTWSWLVWYGSTTVSEVTREYFVTPWPNSALRQDVSSLQRWRVWCGAVAYFLERQEVWIGY